MTLESENRLQTAISGGKPDRVPTAPLFYYFAARNAGVTIADLVHKPRVYREVIERCWQDFGPWDVYYPLNHINREVTTISVPMKAMYPGDEIDENESVQFLEEEVMTPEDYDILTEPAPPLDMENLRAEFKNLLKSARKKVAEKGLAGVIAAMRSRLPDPFKSVYGDRRDPEGEIQSLIAFTSTLARLIGDPEIQAEHSFRYLRLLARLSGRIRERGGPETILGAISGGREQMDFTRYDFAAWKTRGVTPLFGMAFEGAFDTFSMARSMLPFSSNDLFERPDKIKEACETSVPLFITLAELGAALTGVPRFLYAAHRTSNDFISPTHFRELAFPSMRQITEQLAARGITTIFHCDGRWDLNLEYLAQLPEGKCAFQFDGRTDMPLARKILGPGHCIFGDVPSTMLAFAEPAEVTAYCKKLIKEIGADGRFILGAGCEVPPNAKPDNVRAMLRAPLDS